MKIFIDDENTVLPEIFKRSLYAAIVGLILLATGCATPHPETMGIETYSIPYRYANSLGVSENPIEDVLSVPDGSEADIVSRAIVSALQELELSIVKPELSVGEQLPEKQLWFSDRAPLDSAQVNNHNVAHPDMILPPRKYEIQYSGEYVVGQRELIFKMSAQLHERALATDWRQVDQAYSGNYFVDRLLQLIEEKLHAVIGDLPI